MKLQFERSTITIQATANKWGPFNFNFEEGLPPGRTLSSFTVASYLGRVKPDDSDTLSSFTDTTTELINSTALDSTNLIGSVYFDRPTTSAYINAKHSLVFTITLDAAGGGGTHAVFYYSVSVI